MSRGNDFDRRTVLKRIGQSSVAIGGLSGLAAADDGQRAVLDAPDYETTELSQREARTHLDSATAIRSGESIAAFLRDEGYDIDQDAISARRVTSPEFPDHVLLDAKVHNSEAETGELRLRKYDSTVTPEILDATVTAEATIDETTYRSTPLTSRAAGGDFDGKKPSSSRAGKTGVVESVAWQRRRTRQVASASDWPWNCMVSGTFAADGAICMVLGGITTIAGGVLMLIPEPGSTAVGAVAVSTVLTGSCTLAEGLEAALNTDCEINSIGLCVTYPGILSPSDVYVFPAGDCYAY